MKAEDYSQPLVPGWSVVFYQPDRTYCVNTQKRCSQGNQRDNEGVRQSFRGRGADSVSYVADKRSKSLSGSFCKESMTKLLDP